MREIKQISVTEIEPDPDQPRRLFHEDESLYLGQSMLDIDQQLPVIVFPSGSRYTLADGERRWRAAQLVGIKTLTAIVLPEKPTPSALHVVQMSLEAHKVGLTAMERSNLLAQIQKENNWSVTELAEKLHMKQPLVSKLLGYQRLTLEVQKLLHTGELDMEKAYVISQQPSDKQVELAKAAGLSREDLRRHIRSGGQDEPKASNASFTLAGAVITLRGRDLTLSTAIEVLGNAIKELRKGLAQGLDISTQQRVMKDRANSRRS
jgi:ParB/RepB/Spo0J family partition protein